MVEGRTAEEILVETRHDLQTEGQWGLINITSHIATFDSNEGVHQDVVYNVSAVYFKCFITITAFIKKCI